MAALDAAWDLEWPTSDLSKTIFGTLSRQLLLIRGTAERGTVDSGWRSAQQLWLAHHHCEESLLHLDAVHVGDRHLPLATADTHPARRAQMWLFQGWEPTQSKALQEFAAQSPCSCEVMRAIGLWPSVASLSALSTQSDQEDLHVRHRLARGTPGPAAPSLLKGLTQNGDLVVVAATLWPWRTRCSRKHGPSRFQSETSLSNSNLRAHWHETQPKTLL